MSRFLHIVAFVVVFSLSIPLATLAAVTTTLAFSTLFVRLLIVYVELGMALVHSWLVTITSPIKRHSQPRDLADVYTPRPKFHRRRKSATFPVKDITTAQIAPRKSMSFNSYISSSGPNRDFEGVGGWSLAPEEENNTNWANLNSRLQLPTPGGEHRRRHHQRSLTSQSQRYTRSPEAARMSPVEVRSRTPNIIDGTRSPESYFNAAAENVLLMSPEEMVAKIRMDERQKSLDSSGTSSPTSSRRRSLLVGGSDLGFK